MIFNMLLHTGLLIFFHALNKIRLHLIAFKIFEIERMFATDFR